ncbi:4-(cytidine 5'-diphospho)-2-C-methyl-D-erythritol kinase [Pinibacter soli]|uniref:4-diphosphocytidyl-2-C-methyl-D-erythritol kinase n=1 Tax=Pinibacter soli TaxID=3044211 RepID=A0ABT6RH91_9BACT|nr:4-(cytidine 5'-diphospho)-2-C-methyl-D-erythritol kinase [Pinibacter soli]MDI3321939.1 4-(cytidine 5'-diphospho)-2-C-methyl-D-erythritol kinase [Pinibacter soli]
MISFPICKINLGLHIVGKRNDGYHNLETIFYPIALNDVLEIIQADTFSFKATGIPVDGDPAKNLCVRAYDLLKQKFDLPPVYMHLHKAIPLGAGLGGGSSDGAATLLLLNQKFQLKLSPGELIDLALQLGSDCPFFIINKPCIASGRGEILQPIDVPALKGLKIIIVNPGIHVNTGWAFSQITPTAISHSLSDIIAQPITTWKNVLKNDFEEAVFAAHPAIKNIKDQLYAQGALYASMSGSGASLFGIFNKNNIAELRLPENYFVHQSDL